MKYQEINKITVKKAEKLFNSSDNSKIARAIISICLYGENYDFAINTCKRFFHHEELWIRVAVLNSLVYILYNFGKLDKNLTNDVLSNASRSNDLKIKDVLSHVQEDLKNAIPNFKF